MSPQLKGILFLILSGAILAFTDGLAKYLTGRFALGEIVFFRACFVFTPIVFMVWRRGGLSSLRVASWKAHLARAACVAVTTFMFIGAVRHLPLADATAILFASPIFVTALAPAFLGEQVGWRRWVAVIVGFSGVLLMIRPDGNPLVWSALLALGATFFLSLRDMITRRMSGTESSNAIMFFSTAFIGFCGAMTLPLGWFIPGIGHWRVPNLEEFGILALTGILQGTGQYFMVTAFLLAEAVVVVPFRYFSLIFAAIYGFLLFGDVPGFAMLSGAAVVIASGLYIFQREVRMGRRAHFQEGQKAQ
jgi:drug/metabolite transporter (DMT)-like permease